MEDSAVTSLPYELKYKTARHDKVRDEVRARYEMSRRRMREYHEKWKRAEELYLSFIKKTDEDKLREKETKDGRPQYTTIYLPYSYALLLSAVSYWTTVFLSRDPVFQLTGRHGESQQQVQAFEALLDYQVQVGRMLVPLYIWLHDAGKYGFGVICNYWAEEKHRVSSIMEVPEYFGPVPTGNTKKKLVTNDYPGYYGNKIFNVRPYDFFPDPRVSLVNFQSGEFCGRRVELSWNYVLKQEADGYYFNVEEARRAQVSHDTGRDVGSSEVDLPLTSLDEVLSGSTGKNYLEAVEMIVEIIPREWDLGDGSYPEKWVFTLAAKQEVVIGAQPLGLVHDMYPYFIVMYEIDGYSQTSNGMMKVLEPLNDTMSWLFNSHFYAVRRSLNGNYAVDPSRVVMKDLLSEGPGKVIRLSPRAYGQDPRAAIHEIGAGSEATRRHLADASVVAEMMQRACGVTDNVMGMINPGGRKSATEIRTSTSFSVNRMKTFCEYNSALGFSPLVQALVQNTQQLYDQSMMFRIAGDLMEGARYVQVTPDLIAGFYDFVPVDGTLPIDRIAQTNLWKELLLGISQVPALAQSFDLTGIFIWIAQLAGLKNITRFRLQVQPDQSVLGSGELKPVVADNPEAVGQTNIGPGTRGGQLGSIIQ